MKKDQFERLRDWMDQLKDLAQRKVKKYANIEEGFILIILKKKKNNIIKIKNKIKS